MKFATHRWAVEDEGDISLQVRVESGYAILKVARVRSDGTIDVTDVSLPESLARAIPDLIDSLRRAA